MDLVDDVQSSDLVDSDSLNGEGSADEVNDDDNNNDDADDADHDDVDELDVMKELSEDAPKKDYSFQLGHSQYATHSAHMKKDNPLVVPNFLPTTLPRSDHGDREYCCAMLTFSNLVVRI